MKKITIEFDRRTGGMKFEAVGYQGGDCHKALDDLIAQIGGRTTSTTQKRETQRVLRQTRRG
jgi:hypothetical protein